MVWHFFSILFCSTLMLPGFLHFYSFCICCIEEFFHFPLTLRFAFGFALALHLAMSNVAENCCGKRRATHTATCKRQCAEHRAHLRQPPSWPKPPRGLTASRKSYSLTVFTPSHFPSHTHTNTHTHTQMATKRTPSAAIVVCLLLVAIVAISNFFFRHIATLPPLLFQTLGHPVCPSQHIFFHLLCIFFTQPPLQFFFVTALSQETIFSNASCHLFRTPHLWPVQKEVFFSFFKFLLLCFCFALLLLSTSITPPFAFAFGICVLFWVCVFICF